MRVIDVEKYPRGVIRYTRYLAAKRCPRCGAVLTYFYDKPSVTLPEGSRATLVELRCPRCNLAPVDVFAVPQVGMDEDVIEENFHCEMEYIADVTLAVQARAANKVEGIALRETRQEGRKRSVEEDLKKLQIVLRAALSKMTYNEKILLLRTMESLPKEGSK